MTNWNTTDMITVNESGLPRPKKIQYLWLGSLSIIKNKFKIASFPLSPPVFPGAGPSPNTMTTASRISSRECNVIQPKYYSSVNFIEISELIVTMLWDILQIVAQ